MKRRFIQISLTVVSSLSLFTTYAQSNGHFAENVKRIESYVGGPVKTNICDGKISFPAKYEKQKVEEDSFIASFIQNAVNCTGTEHKIDQLLTKISKSKKWIKEFTNGQIKIKEIVLKGNYLRVPILLEFVDKVIVRMKVTLQTSTHAKCGDYENNMIDFKLIKDYYLLHLPLLFTIEYDEMVGDSIYIANLHSLAKKREDIRFNIPGSHSEKWVNDIFRKQYQADSLSAYNSTSAPSDFVNLISQQKWSEIEDLLFSPNYLVSVNAMEAMIYLASVNKIVLTKEVQEKMNKIKTGPSKFRSRSGHDVYYTMNGYKDLQTTDNHVIKKYASSLPKDFR